MEHSVSPSDDPPSGGSSSFPGAATSVVPWLERSRALGFLGPGPVAAHVTHALGFAEAAGEAPARFVDLGSGGGVPGLVLAALWTDSEAVLLDSNERRTAFLDEAVAGLGWAGRVRVVRARAEEAGHRPDVRGRFRLVVSRSFGPPAATAECAAPLLAVGGRLVVSEPPGEPDPSRWPHEAASRLGLAPGDRRVASDGATFRILTQVAPCPPRYPRRVGLPVKRPLW